MPIVNVADCIATDSPPKPSAKEQTASLRASGISVREASRLTEFVTSKRLESKPVASSFLITPERKPMITEKTIINDVILTQASPAFFTDDINENL